jgi:hypothetical protein
MVRRNANNLRCLIVKMTKVIQITARAGAVMGML